MADVRRLSVGLDCPICKTNAYVVKTENVAVATYECLMCSSLVTEIKDFILLEPSCKGEG